MIKKTFGPIMLMRILGKEMCLFNNRDEVKMEIIGRVKWINYYYCYYD